MKLPKLLPLQLTTDAYSVVTEKNPMLTDRQAAECIRRVELHDELVEALKVAEKLIVDGGLRPVAHREWEQIKAAILKAQGA